MLSLASVARAADAPKIPPVTLPPIAFTHPTPENGLQIYMAEDQ